MLKILKCWKPYCSVRYFAKQSKEMKYLNVAEKHDAAKTIASLLSNGSARRREGYSVYNKVFDFDAQVKGRNCKMVMTSVSGHLLQLEFLVSYRNWRNVDPQVLFDAPIRKSCGDDFQPVKRTLEREIRNCQGLIIWTDCDREGENIGFEIIEVCRAIKPNITVYRAIFSEITSAAVRRALQQLTTPDKRQSDAVDVRSELDLRTGASITRFQTMRLQRLFPEKIADKLISYGSCQIPTLGFVAERYKEVEAFVSEPFWKIKVLHTIDDLTVEFNWARNRLFDKQACEDYLLICLADPRATVESVTVKPKSKWRPTPLDTVELEKLGSRKLKLSAKETMTIAEKLYTKGIISYPRTETNQFSKELDLKTLVEHQTPHTNWGAFAQRVIEWGPNPRNGNKSDQAHPPIHPLKLATNLEGNEARIYELICRHFLACVSKDATGSETVVHINIADEKFTATGLCIYERNYLDVYIYDKWNAKQIHKYEREQIFEPTEISMHEGATTAPPLLTEADLIALMEKHGIGTDATHADHINTIKERGYIGVVDKGFLVPGVIGMGLYEGYDAMQLALAKPMLRAEFESDLKKICLGEKVPQTVLREQIQKYKEAYKQIMEKITAMDEKIALRLNETPNANARSTAGSNNVGDNTSDSNLENNPNRIQELFQCPKCAIAPLSLKQKRNQSGHFIGCLNFPDCKNAIWLPDECKQPTVLTETCPKCGSNVKLLKFKFSTAYHKSMFNTPSGWYKTCLRCDAHFRNAFDINLECVKRAGAIVGDANTNATTTTTATTTIRTATVSTSAPHSRQANNGRSTSAPTIGRNNRPGNSTTAPTAAQTRKKKTATQTNRDPTLRSYFTAATSANRRETTPSVAQRAVNDSTPLDAFFDSNDSFDDILLNAEAEANIAGLAAATTNATSSSGNQQQQRRETSTSVSSAQMAAAFADDDNANDDFGNYAWGTRNTTASEAASRTTTTHQVATRAPAALDDSFAAIFLSEDEFDLDNYAWGSASRNGVASASTAKRPRLAEATQQTNNAAALLEREQPTSPTTQTHSVKCTGCHQLAKELTVKKDGPNKGRLFYACAKSAPCKFFQWADEPSQTSNARTATPMQDIGWGTGGATSAATRSNNNDATANTSIKKCHCGTTASSLTVRKDGPNKGRPFYACANRDKSCGYFKWADEDAGDNDQQASTSWGSGGNATQRNFMSVNRNSQTSDGSKKRKCGLCRQEGHTKLKCPRKAEFEF